MITFFHDVRYSLRTLIRQPLFTAVVVSVLALGIGANTAVFSVINTVLLRPLPYPQSNRLVLLHECSDAFADGSVSYENYLDWRAAQRSFSDLALVRGNTSNVTFSTGRGEPPEQIGSAEVTANFLAVLGIHPVLGRDFTETEDTPGGAPAVILSDAFWRRHFDANAAVLGQRLVLDGVTREIVGILPPEATYPRSAQVYVPLGDLRKDPKVLSRGFHAGFASLGRLKPGLSLAQARDDLNSIAVELERRYPDTNAGRRVHAQIMLDYLVGDYQQNLYLLLAAVAGVLLIACANVAGLQFARASAKQKEFAVRIALGASRARLMRQMLTDGAVLAVLGGALSLVLALWAIDAITALGPKDIARFHDTHLDLTALIFTMAAALGTGLLVGIWPAWRLSRTEVMAVALHEGNARGSSDGRVQRRARSLLVVAQVAISVVLLTGGGLALQSFWHALNTPLGFRPDGILMMSISLPSARYPKAKITPFYDSLLERVRALPGVAAACTSGSAPFSGSEWDDHFHVTGTPPTPPDKEPEAQLNFLSPDYFKVMGIPLLRGRDFDAHDAGAQPRPTIIDDQLARACFPGQEAVGQHIDENATLAPNAPPMTVIGVVGHTLTLAPGTDPRVEHMAQMHYCGNPLELADLTLLVRVASGDPLRLAEPVRRAVLAIDPELPVASVTTMEQNISESLAPRRLSMVLLGTFAVLALLLAGLGLYGVMALSVTQRTREMGIRLALGAQRRDLLALVLGQGARLVGAGLAMGLFSALGLSRLVSSLFYGVGSNDPLTFAGVSLLLAMIGLLASYLPARRATRIDPLTALREE